VLADAYWSRWGLLRTPENNLVAFFHAEPEGGAGSAEATTAVPFAAPEVTASALATVLASPVCSCTSGLRKVPETSIRGTGTKPSADDASTAGSFVPLKKPRTFLIFSKDDLLARSLETDKSTLAASESPSAV
jgi:hypothetical protein